MVFRPNGRVRKEEKGMKIRENEKKHLEELKSWLASQRETPLEEMDGFFAGQSEYLRRTHVGLGKGLREIA